MGRIDLEVRFRNDLDELAGRFLSLYALKYSADVASLASPVARWLDFRLRYVAPKPRLVIQSNRLPKNLPSDIQAGWNTLSCKMASGQDINPYQTDRLIRHNDTSAARPASRTDRLWASWGILHFHLTDKPVPPGAYFSERTSHQAFCLIDDDTVAVIDIRPHPRGDGYSDPDFLNIVAENWPGFLERFEINAVLAGAPQTAADIHRLRNSSINSLITVRGKSYIGPGFGLTGARTSLRQQMAHIQVNRDVQALADAFDRNAAIIQTCLDAADPDYGLTVTPSGVMPFERKSSQVVRLDASFAADFPSLHGLFPDWALQKYRDYQGRARAGGF